MAIDMDKLQEFLGRFVTDLGATFAAGNVVTGITSGQALVVDGGWTAVMTRHPQGKAATMRREPHPAGQSFPSCLLRA